MRCSNSSIRCNSFKILSDSDDEVSTENKERKAKKKLNEIKRLENKNPDELTPQEINKINTKDKWLDILRPVGGFKSSSVNHDTCADIQRKKKQLERNIIKNKKTKKTKKIKKIKKTLINNIMARLKFNYFVFINNKCQDQENVKYQTKILVGSN